MTIQNFSQHLDRLSGELRRQLQRDLPKKLGNLAVRKFKENFQKQSFFGRAWQEVKRRILGAKGAAGRRKILTGPTGNLGRSIQFTTRVGSVTVESDLPYIPQRQFMGEHPELSAAIEKKITEEIDKILKK